MSDDLKVQQRPSTTPYVLGGGLVGGVAGWGATKIDAVKKHVSEVPKYSSHEEWVKAAKDNFEKTLEHAEEFEAEEKSFVEKFKAGKADVEKAGTDWEAAKTRFIEDGQKVVGQAPDTDEIKQLSKQLEAANAKLAESEKALLAATPKESIIKPNRLDVLTTNIAEQEKNINAKETVLKLKNDIAELTNKLELAKNKNLIEEKRKSLGKEIDNIMTRLNEITDLFNSKNNVDKTALEAERKELSSVLGQKYSEFYEISRQNRTTSRISLPKANISSDYPRLVEGMQKNEALLEEIVEQRKDLIQRLAKDPNSAELQKELSNLAKKEEGIRKAFEQQKAQVFNPENLTKEMQEKLAKYNAQESFINDKLDDYARNASRASKKEGGTERVIKQSLADLRDDIFGKKGADGKVIKEGLTGLSKSEKEAVFNQAKEQFNDRIALFDRIHGDELKLNELKEQYNRLTPTRRRIFDEHTDQIKKNIKKEAQELENSKKMLEIAEQRKKHIQKMWNARKEARKLDAKKVADATFGDIKAKEFNYTSFTDSLDKTQKDLLKAYQKETRKRAPQVIKTTPATEGLAAAVETNKNKVADLTSQIAKKRAELPKQATKTAEELGKEYVEKFGTKEKATQEAAENVVKNLKDDCGRWLEQATKTKTGKVAMIAAGTAIAGALIGLALRPSKKEA